MIEPESPVTLYAKHTSFPAVLLSSDEGKLLDPSWVILRHRHLRQQQRVVQGLIPKDTSGAKPTRGTSVPLTTTETTDTNTVVTSPLASMQKDTSVLSSAIQPIPEASPSQSRPATSNTVRHKEPLNTDSSGDVGDHGDIAVPEHPSSALHDVPAVPASKEAPSTGLHVVRHERGIRTRNEKTVWFSSSNLYVHNCTTDGFKQAWLCIDGSHWRSVDLGHPHPYLKGYLLNFCANGEPSWVTKDTIRTYKGRAKKRGKERKETPSPSSPAGSP